MALLSQFCEETVEELIVVVEYFDALLRFFSNLVHSCQKQSVIKKIYIQNSEISNLNSKVKNSSLIFFIGFPFSLSKSDLFDDGSKT
jgi:hypothetical protein